jgi:malate synthase
MKELSLPSGVEIRGPINEDAKRVLTLEALELVAGLAREFRDRVKERLAARDELQIRLDSGKERLDFLPETAEIRKGDWKVAPLPKDLLDRRVEITGPVDRKMIINALNSGANVFMADFEDANAPTWANLMEGQAALAEAVRGTLRFESPKTGKKYALKEKIATLLVRPRGWHLREEHMLVDGEAVPGGLFDFGLFFFHNAKEQLQRGSGPYFYLPKLEHHLEARIWNDAFLFAQKKLGIPQGTIKATVLIETLPAAFQMDEILFELKEHSSGLNCGRWDYIFSFIKRTRNDASTLLPDRGQITMNKAFLKAYSQLLIKTCHRRHVHAMGGMAAQIPIKNDPQANEIAVEKVRADKLREVKDGHDGTWVAHPGLVSVAREVFDAHMPDANQLSRLREDIQISSSDLLSIPTGTRTEAGLRHNIRVGVQYLEAWLRGQGCVPIYNLMEDAATAEISRAQVWQWLKFNAILDNGTKVTKQLFASMVEEEMKRIAGEVGEARYGKGPFQQAKDLFVTLSTAEHFEEFLTLPAYAMLIASERGTAV